MRRSILLAALALAALPSCSLDAFLFSPRKVDEYHWDQADPNLDGELTDPHPSIVTPPDRSEGLLASAHGEQIHWVFAHHASPLATIVYSHGTSRNIGRYWDRVERMWSHGFSVLIYDYPGYGRSTGTPTEAGVIAAGEAALAHALTLADVDPARVILMGYSLGGGPTYALAAEAAEGRGPPIAAVISESTFCSVEALVQDGSFLDLTGSYFANAHFDNCARIAELSVPVLLIHGLADDFVVPHHEEMLADHARMPPRTLLVPGAHHSDVPLVAGDTYDQALLDFVADALP